MDKYTLSPQSPGSAAHAGRVRLHYLDGLRGFMALYVVLFHLGDTIKPLGAFAGSFSAALAAGWFPVDVFFLVSGFTMAHVYGQTFAHGTKPADVRAFLFARVARLYPVHLLVLLLMFALIYPRLAGTATAAWPDGPASLPAFFLNLFMLQGPWLDHTTWNYPSWSISAEFHAYLLFPFACAFVRGRRSALILSACGVLVVTAFYLWAGPMDVTTTSGPLSLLRVLPLFVCGMAAYRLRDLGAGRGTLLMLAGLTGAVLCVQFAALWPLSPLCLFPILLGAAHAKRARKFLETRVAVFLGRISYSLYMVHVPVIGFVVNIAIDRLQPDGGTLPLWLLALIAVGGLLFSIALAQLMCRCVETPARAWLNAWYLRRQKKDVLAWQ